MTGLRRFLPFAGTLWNREVQLKPTFGLPNRTPSGCHEDIACSLGCGRMHSWYGSFMQVHELA
jgi:hypothetical protein